MTFNPLQLYESISTKTFPDDKKYILIQIHHFCGQFAHFLPDVTGIPFTTCNKISIC
jgi:hypothetical protein